MDQHGLSRADLIPVLGTASRVSEVLIGKRELSMTMVRKLRVRFHILADLLIAPLKVVRNRGVTVAFGSVVRFHRSQSPHANSDWQHRNIV